VLHQVYTLANPQYTGRVTVPVLWDRQQATIVSNESSEIIRMMNSAFDGLGARPGDYYPLDLRAQIDAVNARIYDTVNNGVYKAGFATSQAAYEESVRSLFDTLDWLEASLPAALAGRKSFCRSRHPALYHTDPFRRRICRALRATCAESSTIRPCQPICGISTNGQASQARSISCTSRALL
jgi:glutathionyl-hydroquinone reductase